MIPKKLYHATYKQFLKSIQQKGLGNTKRKMWTDSVRGVVYLADDPWVAESYAEESEWVDEREDPDAYLDNIIILEVDVSKLDKNKLEVDKNVLLDEGAENATWEYHGIIPWEACKIFDSSTANNSDASLTEDIEDYTIANVQGHFEAYKDNKFVCSCDTVKEIEAELEAIEATNVKHKYRLTYAIVDSDDSIRYKSINQIEAENEQAAKCMITDPNAFDIKAIKLESTVNSFADEFRLYEGLWD